jgi:ubiquinone/menaquinone biosynthesis C-methylase UbiE
VSGAVPREAAIGFQAGAADYERGRPTYPDAAYALLASELGIGPGRRVLDLAAGTGKLTRGLIGLGADVVAVEPVAAMRDQLRRAVPGVQVLEGTAEHLPFPDAAVDAVCVAQAFHWFDVPVAAAEIHRVLVVGGGLAVIRNEWDPSVAWIDELQQILRQQPGHAPTHPSLGWREQLAATGLFSPLSEQVVPNPLRTDMETLLARVASLSFIAAMPAAERDQVLEQVRRLAHDRGAVGVDGQMETPYCTHVVWCRRSDAGP